MGISTFSCTRCSVASVEVGDSFDSGRHYDFRDAELSRSGSKTRSHSKNNVNASHWRDKLTSQNARELYEAEGTLPPNCSNQLLELRMHLSEILLVKKFGLYARDQNKLNVLMCWADILEFKDIREKQVEYQFSKALNIYQQYIAPNAPSFVENVHVSDSHREEIRDQIESARLKFVGVDTHMFDHFHQEALHVINTEIFQYYKKTAMYRESVAELRKAYNQVLVDDFEYYEQLGTGGFGCVVHCKKKSTGIHYAMKIQTKSGQLANFEDDPARVMAEKNALVSCHHPFIVSMDYALQTDMLTIMVMDLSTAGSLHDAVAFAPSRSMSEDRVRFYTAEILLALAHIHRMGLIYRDIKPANVLLYKDGHIKLADFGGVVDVGGKVLGYVDRNFDVNEAATESALFQPTGARDVAEISRSLKGNHASSTFGKSLSKSARVKATKLTPQAEDEEQPKSTHSGDCGEKNGKGEQSNSRGEDQEMSSTYRLAEPPTLLKARSIMGTGGFMAPEMLAMLSSASDSHCSPGYTCMVDYWSLGVSIFKLQTGHMLFHNVHIASFVEYISLPSAEQEKTMPNYLTEYAQFLDAILNSSKGLSPTARQFLTSLLHVKYKQRLGYGTDGVKELKSHAYFRGIDWNLLAGKQLTPPFLPINSMEADDCHEEKEERPLYASFDEMFLANKKAGWCINEITAEQQLIFESWDFVSAGILKVELGIAADMILSLNKRPLPFLQAVGETISSVVSKSKSKVSPSCSSATGLDFSNSVSSSVIYHSQSQSSYNTRDVLGAIERSPYVEGSKSF